jgi:hypothetical protein
MNPFHPCEKQATGIAGMKEMGKVSFWFSGDDRILCVSALPRENPFYPFYPFYPCG